MGETRKRIKEICKIGKTNGIIASGMLTERKMLSSSIFKAAGGVALKQQQNKIHSK
jgi:hypothetical protein